MTDRARRLARATCLPALVLAACGGASGRGAPTPPPSPPRTEVTIQAAEATVTVSVPAAGTARLRFARGAQAAPPPSFAVDPAALGAPLALEVEEREDAVVVRAADLAVRVTRSPLRVALLDAAGEILFEEAAPVAWASPGFASSWELRPGDHAYALGDRDWRLDHRGGVVELWNSDGAPGSYRAFPFLLLVRDGAAHGLFVDSAAYGVADVGARDPGRVTYRSDRGDAVDLYLFSGPGPKEVLAAYTALTGRAPMPPRWALGYHQCRYSYLSAAEVRDVTGRLRADAIPADALWLDIDFQDGYAPFTVDAARFPDLPGLVRELRADGFRTVVITDPHLPLRTGYAPYATGLAGDHLVRTAAGPPFVGDVWPGASVFPEFTLSRTRAWWGGLYQGFVDAGIAGFWNDMNEPAIFSGEMPAGTPHRLDDGTSVDHRAVHNAYGALTARATREGQLALRPGVRPFVLSRAGTSGLQRWAATWTGDNYASRGDLAATIPMLLNLGLSGVALAGADVGGFFGCPDADLLVEWMELGALQPFFRNHADRSACRHEPWVYGDAAEARMRAAVERRYRLLPYLYTAFEEASRTGVPVMRPLWLEHPADPAAYAEPRAYLLGRDLLVAPKLAAGTAPYAVGLPTGADWWDTRTGERHAGGGAVTVAPAPDDSVRVFARGGAIVPQQPLVQHTGQVPDGPLALHVWPGAPCAGALYLDDGESLAYLDGASRRVAYACHPGEGGITVTAASTGAFPAWWTSTEVVLHGVPRDALEVTSSLGAVSARYDPAQETLTVALAGEGGDWTVAARW